MEQKTMTLQKPYAHNHILSAHLLFLRYTNVSVHPCVAPLWYFITVNTKEPIEKNRIHIFWTHRGVPGPDNLTTLHYHCFLSMTVRLSIAFDHFTYAHLPQFSLAHLRPITSHHLSSPPMPHKSQFSLLYPCLMYFALWLCQPSSLSVHIYPRHLHDIFIDALCLSLAVISNSLQKWSQIAPNLTDCAS